MQLTPLSQIKTIVWKSKTATGSWKQLIIESQQNNHFNLKKQTHIFLLKKKIIEGDNLTRVLYKLMSTSRPLLTWKNLTIGTLAVVIGRTFLKPRMKCLITE